MGSQIKICIVGAGSSYTPELIDGILKQDPGDLPIVQINLQDIDPARLRTMADLAKRMISAEGCNIKIESSEELERMAEGCDFIITQIRVGGMKARYLDETIPLKYGIIGQETTGPGGMFKAIRTIPEMIKICDIIKKYSPDAFILNYTNPSGIIAETVSKYSNSKIIGLCSGIPDVRKQIKSGIKEIYPNSISYSIGLNHLGYIYKILNNDMDITSSAIEYLYDKGKLKDMFRGDRELAYISKLLNAVPIGYLMYYYLHDRELKKMLGAKETRAQEIMKIEKALFKEINETSISQKPSVLSKRGGGGYSITTFSVMSAIFNNRKTDIAASVKNNGCIKDIDDDAFVEVVCEAGKHGLSPIPVGKIPVQLRGLIQSVKAYETLTIEATINKSRDNLYKALLNHPIVRDMTKIKPLVQEMLTAHKIDF